MGGGERSCDSKAAFVFIVGLIAGTVCIITSKSLFELSAVGNSGKEEPFKPPVFETFVMFFGMVFALPMYLTSEVVKRCQAHGDPVKQAALKAETPITLKMLFILGIPSVFDLCSVRDRLALCIYFIMHARTHMHTNTFAYTRLVNTTAAALMYDSAASRSDLRGHNATLEPSHSPKPCNGRRDFQSSDIALSLPHTRDFPASLGGEWHVSTCLLSFCCSGCCCLFY